MSTPTPYSALRVIHAGQPLTRPQKAIASGVAAAQLACARATPLGLSLYVTSDMRRNRP